MLRAGQWAGLSDYPPPSQPRVGRISFWAGGSGPPDRCHGQSGMWNRAFQQWKRRRRSVWKNNISITESTECQHHYILTRYFLFKDLVMLKQQMLSLIHHFDASIQLTQKSVELVGKHLASKVISTLVQISVNLHTFVRQVASGSSPGKCRIIFSPKLTSDR